VVGFSRVRVSRVRVRIRVSVRIRVRVRLRVRLSFSGANLNRKTLGGELLPERPFYVQYGSHRRPVRLGRTAGVVLWSPYTVWSVRCFDGPKYKPYVPRIAIVEQYKPFG